MEYLLLIVGFVLLIKGADLFVDGSSAIAAKLKIPSIIVGLTIVAFGTSAPEAAVSIAAAVNKNNGIAVGNVVGSNIFNLLVVVGVSAVICALPVDKGLLNKDYPFSILAAAALLAMSADKVLGAAVPVNSSGVLSRGDGIVLLLMFAIFMYSTITAGLSARNKGADENLEAAKKTWLQCILISVIGIAGIIFGGDLTVDAATKIAKSLGMSDTLVGLTIVAIGTSLPELVTSIVATKKGENDLALGNVVGSNLFNIFFVLGMSATVNPILITSEVITDLIMLIAVNIVVLVWLFKTKKVTKTLGIFMLIIYVAYMAYAIAR